VVVVWPSITGTIHDTTADTWSPCASSVRIRVRVRDPYGRPLSPGGPGWGASGPGRCICLEKGVQLREGGGCVVWCGYVQRWTWTRTGGGMRERSYAAALETKRMAGCVDANGGGGGGSKEVARRGRKAERGRNKDEKDLHRNVDDVEPRGRTTVQKVYDAMKTDNHDWERMDGQRDEPYGTEKADEEIKYRQDATSKESEGKPEEIEGTTIVHHKTELPRRPGKPPCAFYMRMGTCKFGSTCKFDHPDLQNMATPGHMWKAYPYNMVSVQATMHGNYPTMTLPFVPPTTNAVANEENGTLPNGHAYEPAPKEPSEISGDISSSQGHASSTSQGTQEFGVPVHAMSYQYGGMLPMSYANMFPYMYAQAGGMPPQAYVYNEASPYPVRADAPDCTYYMKTGHCRFGATCKFNHPPERLAQLSSTSEGGVSLNSLGLPIRPGATECSYYMKTRTCKFGRTCKFHHPELMSYLTAMVPGSHGIPMYPQHLMYPQTGGHHSTGTVPSHGSGMLSNESSVLPPTVG